MKGKKKERKIGFNLRGEDEREDEPIILAIIAVPAYLLDIQNKRGKKK